MSRKIGDVQPEDLLRRRVAGRSVDDAVLLNNAATGEYYGLESTALRIWQLIEQPRTVAAVCGELAKEYAVDPATCESDLLEFVAALLREGLIEIV